MKGYFRKRGSLWSFTVDIGRKPDGSRNQKTRSGFKTKKEAEQACAELITQINKGDYLEPSKKTVQDAMEAWLNTILLSTLRISTYDNYSKAIVKRIIPALGKMKLKDVQADHIQSFYSSLVREGLSPEYIRYLHSILKSFFSYQVRLQNITKNIVELAIPPRIGRKEQRTWSIGEAVRFLEVTKEDNHSYYVVYLLALYTGLRRGEILALRWRDCDLSQGKVSVRQTLYYSNQQFHFLEPKTSRSNRLISIPDTVVKVLMSHRLEQEKLKREMEGVYEDYDLIAANEIGRPINPRSLTGHFRRMIKKAKVPMIRFHDTRHTHATILLKLGEHVKIVSERLGHSNAAMTMDVYSHVTSDMQEEAAKKFELALRSEEKNNDDQRTGNILRDDR